MSDQERLSVRMQAFLDHLEAATLDACVIVHRLAVERGHVEPQQYVAADGEKPWHRLIYELHYVKARAEKLRDLRQAIERAPDRS